MRTRPSLSFDYLTNVSVNIDGRGILYAPGSSQVTLENAQDTNPIKYIYEANIAASVAAFLAGMEMLYTSAGYFGAVDLGVAS